MKFTMDTSSSINIFTDGACSGNGQANAKAGFAVLIADNNFNVINSTSGKIPGKQTNNRAELFAIFKALSIIDNVDIYTNVNIYSDSEISVKGLKGECARKSNVDIWENIETLCESIRSKGIKINIDHINGHMSDNSEIAKLNNIADTLAKSASRSLI